MKTIRGRGVSGGVAEGVIRFFNRAPQALQRRTAADAKAELARYAAARKTASAQLEKMAQRAREERGGGEAAAMFEAHCAMLDDADFIAAVTALVQREHRSAEAAVEEAGARYAAQFAALPDEYMSARSVDVQDVTARLVRILCDAPENGLQLTQPSLVAADDLTPSETMQLDRRFVRGFLMRVGSPNGHTALLARTLGIPAVIGLGVALDAACEGCEAVMDGSAGCVAVEPDAPTRLRFAELKRAGSMGSEELLALRNEPDVTVDGREVGVYANIATVDDSEAVLRAGAHGIGLFRSEFLYLENGVPPTEEQQLAAYRAVLEHMDGRRVVVRTLDIGADKQSAVLGLAGEENPALGLRGIRLCLARPSMFKTQLRALYRASVFGHLAILFPMVANVWEVREAKRLCEEACAELAAEGLPFDKKVQLGAMVETPAAAVLSDLLAREVDFFSIGTNDLSQYTLAVDRQGPPELARHADASGAAVLRLVRMTVENAHAAGITVEVCGELAADVSMTKTLVGLGVDALSVPPRDVLPVRRSLRGVSYAAACAAVHGEPAKLV